MSWITLSVDDVLPGLSSVEATAHRTGLLSAGQSDPLIALLSSVTEEVRSRVAACPNNSLDADTATIPGECRYHAAALARYRLLSRLPLEIQESRMIEYREALRFLDKVADCKVTIAQPESVSGEVIARQAGPQITARTRQFTRALQDGI